MEGKVRQGEFGRITALKETREMHAHIVITFLG